MPASPTLHCHRASAAFTHSLQELHHKLRTTLRLSSLSPSHRPHCRRHVDSESFLPSSSFSRSTIPEVQQHFFHNNKNLNNTSSNLNKPQSETSKPYCTAVELLTIVVSPQGSPTQTLGPAYLQQAADCCCRFKLFFKLHATTATRSPPASLYGADPRAVAKVATRSQISAL